MTISYCNFARSLLNDHRIHQCAELFSAHYGIWSEKGHSPGQRVKLSMQKLKDNFLFDDNTYIVMAINIENDQVIGHAIGRRFPYSDFNGFISWITQLVVHSDYRNKGIGTHLCQLAWDPNNNIACGLVSSNPYAVAALKKATNCNIDIPKILHHGSELIRRSEIPYLMNAVVSSPFEEKRCVINTQFYVSHEEINKIIENPNGWSLGELREGEEFFVVFFPSRN